MKRSNSLCFLVSIGSGLRRIVLMQQRRASNSRESPSAVETNRERRSNRSRCVRQGKNPAARKRPGSGSLVRSVQRHLRRVAVDDQSRGGRLDHVFDRTAGPAFAQDEARFRRLDDRQFGDDRLMRRVAVSGSEQRGTILCPPLAVWTIATTTRRAPHTRSIAPPMPGTILPGTIQLARWPRSIDLEAAEHGHVEMAAADEAEGHGAVERGRPRQAPTEPPPASVRSRLRHALGRPGPCPMIAILRLKKSTSNQAGRNWRPGSASRRRDGPAGPAAPRAPPGGR